ncbi:MULTISPECIES: AAA family ATPase [Streptomyces]|uniref:AAA domain-containing protein n=1 Tax=Streptomyces thermoviolaceus subsp. thermoviolaceus TaxID=66860 RepID=A0ABX0YUM3_STRTL|nr:MULTISPECIES: AAA family ATPase [Streptomyces]NJP15712.1 AAA domain-containing protein [Streptomyces thermoviolaceus subsp. thermoviolaceus]RSR95391.1 ATPase [Streptomyces sp. WAC00469]WTD46719.1 AAA family ATPase [Streptomyces thermoviolaceus]GHA95479.1 ATPase AAA [Streptomyces thermoviolaceus subsp. thermoviolaceus]
MSWTPYYRGTGVPPENRDDRSVLPLPPPWRSSTGRRTTDPSRDPARTYRPAPGLVDAVNAALHLRRPLLLTGRAGSGKSTVIRQIAAELELGEVLHWHITSRSTLADALYRYDALGRIHAHNLRAANGQTPASDTEYEDDIGDFVQLGPLGTALLPGTRPRALLIDEIDKSDLDLPSDLLDVLERGSFEIPELARHPKREIEVRTADKDGKHTIKDGWVQCTEFPVIVLTSNGERDFPAPFLRRCVRFDMPPLSEENLKEIVAAHLGDISDETTDSLLKAFLERLNDNDHVAIDQLLNAVYLLRGDQVTDSDQRRHLKAMLLQGLGRG